MQKTKQNKTTIKKQFLNLELKMPYLGFFAQQFRKTIVIFEVSAFKFVLLQSLVQKKAKNLKFGTRNTLFEYFQAEKAAPSNLSKMSF